MKENLKISTFGILIPSPLDHLQINNIDILIQFIERWDY